MRQSSRRRDGCGGIEWRGSYLTVLGNRNYYCATASFECELIVWQMCTKSPRKELLAALFHSGPIEPMHNCPTTPTGDWSADWASDAEHRFFSVFDIFSDRINQLYTARDSSDGGRPWRLQELADTNLKAGPSFGRHAHRAYSVFYNQAAIGIIKIKGLNYINEENPHVATDVELAHVRLLPFEEVVGFLVTLAGHLACADAEEFATAQRQIDRALLAVVWNTDRSDDDDGTMKLYFSGSPQYYLKWRTLVLNNRARDT